MKATTKEAIKNERQLTIENVGDGRCYVEMTYRNKRIGAYTHDNIAIENFLAEPHETQDGRNRVLKGYSYLCEHILFYNN